MYINIETVGAEDIYPRFKSTVVDLKDNMSRINFEISELNKTYDESMSETYDDYNECFREAIYSFLTDISGDLVD